MTAIDQNVPRNISSVMEKLGYVSFLSPKQRELILAVAGGNNVLGILPTAGGKSAAYVIPTVANGWRTFVVSPLKALMEDQVRKLKVLGFAAFAVHGDTPRVERELAVASFLSRSNQATFIFASPEMILTKWFLANFGRKKIDLLAIDEVHCISTWGLDFRPEYLRIETIWKRYGKPQLIALSATVDPQILEDILFRIPLGARCVRVEEKPYRANLLVRVEKPGDAEKSVKARNAVAYTRLLEVLSSDDIFMGPTMIYCHTQQATEALFLKLAGWSEQLGYTPVIFHAGLDAAHKDHSLSVFLQSRKPLVVSTTAFGMGIDRADVRRVVHFDAPYTLVDYSQQIGRGGRDGLPTLCLAFYSQHRAKMIEGKGVKDIPPAKFVETVYRLIYKEWVEATAVGRSEFGLAGFLYRTRLWVDKNENIHQKDQYMNRMTQALSILRQVGVITEPESGFQMQRLESGSGLHERLLVATGMADRRVLRESERLRKFFRADNPTQELLWEIVGLG